MYIERKLRVCEIIVNIRQKYRAHAPAKFLRKFVPKISMLCKENDENIKSTLSSN